MAENVLNSCEYRFFLVTLQPLFNITLRARKEKHIMRRIFYTILLVLLAVMTALPVDAATKKKSTHKKISKTFKDVPTQQVLEEIGAKCDYTIDYSAADIDLEAPVTVRLKDASASSALKKVLGKAFVIKPKKNVITITNLPVPPTIINSPALTVSRIEEDETKIVKIYEDTTRSIQCRTLSRKIDGAAPVAPKPTGKGHYLQFALGAGYGSMGYHLTDPNMGDKVGTNLGDFQGTAQLQYAYFFTENWGFSLGLGFSGYGSYGVLNHPFSWTGQEDTDGEVYTHMAIPDSWKEQQVTHIAEVPVAIQFMYPVNDKNVRLYGGFGVKVGMPVMNSWGLKNGSVAYEGFYPQHGLQLDYTTGKPDFFVEQIGTDFQEDRHPQKLNPVAVAATADLGFAIPVGKKTDLLIGAYFQMNALDLYEKDAVKPDMGFRQDGKTHTPAYAQMPEYAGMMNTSLAGAVRPWGAGLKIGLQWHPGKKKQTVKPQFERYDVCDTTMTLTERKETVMKPKKEAAKEIVRLMQKAVIWFDVNSTEPKLEPADILDKVVDVLKQNPKQKVIVSGHASKDGNARRNRILSEKRAQAVADLMIEKGANPDQISVEAHASDVEYQVSEGMTHTIELDRRTEIIPVE